MELCGLNWSEIYDYEDPTVIAAKITEKMCRPLDAMAPIKFRNSKTNKKKGLKLSENIRSRMKIRDNLRKKAKVTNDINDWDEWKRSKNEVNREIRKEKATYKENEIKNVSNDTTAKSLWNLVKTKACWTKSLSPTVLKY